MFRALTFFAAASLTAAVIAADGAAVRLLAPPFPCLSQQQAETTLATAYQLQQQHNQLRQAQEPIAGFKAGLTTTLLQQRFRSDGPVLGVLFGFGERTPVTGIRLAELQQPKLEVEIGFIASKAIRQPLKSTAELREYFAEAVPAIEIPDVSFAGGCQPNAIDLVAANVAAAQHLRGTGKRWTELPDLNGLNVRILRDGLEISSGVAKAVQPSIEGSLLFLVNEALRQGYRVEPGQLFITGAMSGLIDAKPGRHVADFGALGIIEFTVQQ